MSDYIPYLISSSFPSHIPEEIQAHILNYFPVKTLLRFRSVCKHWKTLIDSPSFIQHHLSLQNPQFLINYRYPEQFLVSDLSSSFRTLPAPTQHLLGTLHGIVCLYDDHNHHESGLVSLWNPSLRKLSTLPTPPFLHSQWAGDDGSGTTYSSFWIDPPTAQFKIILFKLMVLDDAVLNDGTLYSSITGRWTELGLAKLADLQPFRECPSVVIGRVAYWRAWDVVLDAQERIIGMDVVLISFDFGDERFEILEAPSVEFRECHPVLCSWRGTLSLVYLDDSNVCDVYVMREGCCWVNLFSVRVAQDVRVVHWVMGEIEDDSGVVVEERRNKMLASCERELVLCDTKGGRVMVRSGLVESFECFVAAGFVESLLFPEGLELINY